MPYGTDEPIAWEWRVGGRYNRSYVDKHMKGDPHGGTYGDSIPASSRKAATEIANALNQAFNEGVRYGARHNTSQS